MERGVAVDNYGSFRGKTRGEAHKKVEIDPAYFKFD